MKKKGLISQMPRSILLPDEYYIGNNNRYNCNCDKVCNSVKSSAMSLESETTIRERTFRELTEIELFKIKENLIAIENLKRRRRIGLENCDNILPKKSQPFLHKLSTFQTNLQLRDRERFDSSSIWNKGRVAVSKSNSQKKIRSIYRSEFQLIYFLMLRLIRFQKFLKKECIPN